MKDWKKCADGLLSPVGEAFQTNNKLNFHYSGGGFSCCKWKKFTAINCYLVPTTVFKTQNGIMESPVGSVSHCKYEDGSCQLKDSSYLLWTPNKNASCEIIPWTNIIGYKYGRHFLSSDYNLALTFTKSNWVKDCQHLKVKMSDQGIPLRYLGKPSKKYQTSWQSNLFEI